MGREGLADLIPAVRLAFNADPTDDKLDQVYGPSPRTIIVFLSVACVITGEILSRVIPDVGPNFGGEGGLIQYVNCSAVVISVTFAALIRRYLFSPSPGGGSLEDSDFPWLAASLAAPMGLLILVSFVSVSIEEADDSHVVGQLAVHVADALGAAAAMTISVAALCFNRHWIRGLFDLAVRLLVFRIMVFVTTLVMLDIGIVGPIIAKILSGVFGVRIPDWIADLADQLSYATLMSVIYLAVIGITWTVCRQSFAELLRTGDVNILDTIEELAADPKRREKKLQKLEKKRKKQQKK